MFQYNALKSKSIWTTMSKSDRKTLFPSKSNNGKRRAKAKPSTSSPLSGVSQPSPSLRSFFFKPCLPISFSSPTFMTGAASSAKSISSSFIISSGGGMSKSSSMFYSRKRNAELRNE
uniref:Uncharacterized protein n=1 Tax=Opuntia streptacantha TaxID=393608 RepID=A0A7C9DKW8_OPUST